MLFPSWWCGCIKVESSDVLCPSISQRNWRCLFIYLLSIRATTPQSIQHSGLGPKETGTISVITSKCTQQAHTLPSEWALPYLTYCAGQKRMSPVSQGLRGLEVIAHWVLLPSHVMCLGSSCQSFWKSHPSSLSPMPGQVRTSESTFFRPAIWSPAAYGSKIHDSKYGL